MTIVTVPGASGTHIPNPFGTASNIALAQQIAAALASALSDENLFIRSSDQPAAAVPPGDVGEITVTVAGAANVTLPDGFSYTAVDQAVAGPLTISGGGSLFAGNQDITYYGAPGPDPVQIAAGDGNDQIGLPDGTTYQVALGNGNDTVFANGSGTVDGGSGANLFFADSPDGQNVVNSFGAADTIIAGAGAVSVNSYGADPLIWGGSGSLQYIGSAPGNPTIFGGSGTETLFGGAGQDITYLAGNDTVPGSDILAAGAGNETLDAAGAANGVQLAAGIGSVVMIGSTGDDVFYGGSGAATMIGNGGMDTFQFASAWEPGGQHGGTSIIADFTAGDTFNTVGYGPGAAQAALAAATVTAGSSTVRLPDSTTITFQDVADPAGIRAQSF